MDNIGESICLKSESAMTSGVAWDSELDHLLLVFAGDKKWEMEADLAAGMRRRFGTARLGAGSLRMIVTNNPREVRNHLVREISQ